MGRPEAPELNATVQLKEATREAHMAIKDLRTLMKEVRDLLKEVQQTRDDLETVAQVAFEERLGTAVKESLDGLMNATNTAIDQAMEKVYERFDKVASALLGEEEGTIPLIDYARAIGRGDGRPPESIVMTGRQAAELGDFLIAHPEVVDLLNSVGIDVQDIRRVATYEVPNT